MPNETFRVINLLSSAGIYDDDGRRIAQVNKSYGGAERREALAKQFAAGPELHRVLTILAGYSDAEVLDQSAGFCMRAIAREALAGLE